MNIFTVKAHDSTGEGEVSKSKVSEVSEVSKNEVSEV
jgi:hypothetical protein